MNKFANISEKEALIFDRHSSSECFCTGNSREASNNKCSEREKKKSHTSHETENNDSKSYFDSILRICSITS